jgi:aspartate ammonia-lyase
MNVNEVIANRASELLRRHKKDVAVIHPLDQVNRSQSTNDVNPSALKVASVRLVNRLLEVVDNMISVCDANGRRFKDVYKLGRTHLQDAVPTTLGAEFKAYADILRRDRQRLKEVVPYLLELNLGGTAIGNSINASPKYIRYVYQELRQLTKLQWKPALNFMAQTSSQTDFVMLSQSLTLLLMDASKVANDLRLLSSGPQGGLGEISLPELQEGSSIMPGKVNPVLPEAVNQLFFWGTGNDFTIRQAAAASQLELGVMSPIIADNLIRSLKLSIEVLSKFTSDCLAKVKPHRK